MSSWPVHEDTGAMRRVALVTVAVLAAIALAAIALLPRGGPKVGQNVFVNPAGLIDAYSTPAIAANPRRPANLAIAYRLDRPEFSAQLSWSTDGGASWRKTALLLPDGIDRPFFPDAAFGADGVLYLTYVNLTGRANVPANLFFAHSADGGRTVSSATLVTTGMVYQPRVAVGPDGVIHLFWLRSNRMGQAQLTGDLVRVETARSRDGGLSWSDPVPINPADGRLVSGATALVDKHGVTVVYQRFGTVVSNLVTGGTAPQADSYDMVVTRSSDGGTTFGPPVVAAAGISTTQRFSLFFPQFPAVAAAPDATLYLAWAQRRDRGQDVMVARSVDAGARWSPPVRANDNRPGDGTSRTLPAMSIAANGRIDLLFIDQRGDPSGIYAEAYLASSSDRARSFRNTRLSTSTFDTRVGPMFGGGLPPDLGSHLGLVSETGAVQATWADSRLGTESTGRQDILTARITVPGPGLGPRKWLMVAAALLIALAMAIAIQGWIHPRRRQPTWKDTAG